MFRRVYGNIRSFFTLDNGYILGRFIGEFQESYRRGRSCWILVFAQGRGVEMQRMVWDIDRGFGVGLYFFSIHTNNQTQSTRTAYHRVITVEAEVTKDYNKGAMNITPRLPTPQKKIPNHLNVRKSTLFPLRKLEIS